MDFYKNSDQCFWERSEKYGSQTPVIQYEVIEDLSTEPVTLDFFKQHARIDYNIDDDLCEEYIAAARRYLENWSSLSFGIKTWALRATWLPDNYKLLCGKVDSIDTPDYELWGQYLKTGGSDIDLEFTTKDWIGEDIRVAICRYAAGLYMQRENYDISYNGTVIDPEGYKDKAKEMIRPYANIRI